MSFKNYYKQLNSQTGIKAYIKKKLFNNLLKELVKQENVIEKQKETIKAQGIALKKQERIIKAKHQLSNRVIIESYFFGLI